MFKPGTVVVFNPDSLNQRYWNSLSEKDKIKYYGELGYGTKPLKLFVFLCPILDAVGDTGHCVLLDMDTQKILSMRHTANFRKADFDEF